MTIYPTTAYPAVRVVNTYGAIAYAGEPDAPEEKKGWSVDEIALTVGTLGAILWGIAIVGDFMEGRR